MDHVFVSMHKENAAGGETIQKRSDLSLIAVCRESDLLDAASDRTGSPVEGELPLREHDPCCCIF